jgi:hypothetical protein
VFDFSGCIEDENHEILLYMKGSGGGAKKSQNNLIATQLKDRPWSAQYIGSLAASP